MINRQNWLGVIAFLDYQVTVKQSARLAARSYWARLRHMLEWADEKLLSKAHYIHLTSPAYLDRVEKQFGGDKLSAAQLIATQKTCLYFLQGAKRQYPRRYKGIPDNWIDTLRPSKARSVQAELETRELYTLEDVRTLVSMPATTLHERRIRAGLAFMFLSGMRIGAFMTLPIECVDLDNMSASSFQPKG
jgi:site-specific recombinase XerD